MLEERRRVDRLCLSTAPAQPARLGIMVRVTVDKGTLSTLRTVGWRKIERPSGLLWLPRGTPDTHRTQLLLEAMIKALKAQFVQYDALAYGEFLFEVT